ncbi:MAG: antibiotic biosynthesis monooxygenase [Deltaproteobacteria bacterium]|nr:antibiotic biosynthesis monooxygenase [Deltaproteobacteria bacterium]
MAVKVIIDRELKQEGKEVALELIRKLRAKAMEHRGYISGETLVSNRNPNHVIVVSTWNNIGNWLDWTDNKARNALEEELNAYLSRPTRYEEFSVGEL